MGFFLPRITETKITRNHISYIEGKCHNTNYLHFSRLKFFFWKLSDVKKKVAKNLVTWFGQILKTTKLSCCKKFLIFCHLHLNSLMAQNVMFYSFVLHSESILKYLMPVPLGVHFCYIYYHKLFARTPSDFFAYSPHHIQEYVYFHFSKTKTWFSLWMYF